MSAWGHRAFLLRVFISRIGRRELIKLLKWKGRYTFKSPCSEKPSASVDASAGARFSAPQHLPRATWPAGRAGCRLRAVSLAVDGAHSPAPRPRDTVASLRASSPLWRLFLPEPPPLPRATVPAGRVQSTEDRRTQQRPRCLGKPDAAAEGQGQTAPGREFPALHRRDRPVVGLTVRGPRCSGLGTPSGAPGQDKGLLEETPRGGSLEQERTAGAARGGVRQARPRSSGFLQGHPCQTRPHPGSLSQGPSRQQVPAAGARPPETRPVSLSDPTPGRPPGWPERERGYAGPRPPLLAPPTRRPS